MPDVWDQFPDHPAAQAAPAPTDAWSQFPDHPAVVTTPTPPAAPTWQDKANAEISRRGLNPSNPADAGQMFGVRDAYRQQFGTPQDQGQPTRVQEMEGTRQAQVQAQNQQHGILASNLIEALHPAGEMFARGERMLAPAVGLVAPSAAQNMRTSAQTLEETHGAEGLSSMPGQLAGGLVKYSNPLVAGVSGANEAYTQDEAVKAAGTQMGTGAETAHVIGKGVIDAAVSKIFSGGTPEGGLAAQAERMVQNFVAKKAPEYLAKYGAKAAVGVLVNDAAAVGENALTQQTVDPNRSLTAGLGEATLMGAGVPVLHEALSSARRGVSRPAADQTATPSEGEPQKAGQVEQNIRQLTGADEHQSKMQELKQQAKDLSTKQDAQLQQFPSGEQPKENPASPSELPDAKSVGDWYGKTFNDATNAPAIEALASQNPGKFKLADVPVNRIDPNSIMPGDIDRKKVNAIKAMTPEERAALPPAIAISGGEGDKLMIADGTHRLQGGKEAGDRTIKAYVPEKVANELEARTNAAKAENEANQKVVDEARKGNDRKSLETTANHLISKHGLSGALDAAFAEGDARMAEPSLGQPESVEQRGDTKVYLYHPTIDGKKVPVSLFIKSDGTAIPNIGEAGKNEVGTRAVVALKNELLAKHPEIKRFQFERVGTTGGPRGRQGDVRVPNTPTEPPAAPPSEDKSTSVEPRTPNAIEHYATPIMRQMEDINKTLAGRVFESEYAGRRTGAEWQQNVAPHAQALKDFFKGKDSFEFHKALHEGDIEQAKRQVPEALRPSVDALVDSSKTALEARRAAGVETPELPNHVHFEVKDYKGLQSILGKEIPGSIKTAWDAEIAKTGEPLTPARKTEIANSVLNGYGPRQEGKGGAGFKKERSGMFTRESAAAYKPVWESQHSYLMRAAEDAERQKLMGGDRTANREFENTSIGKLATKELQSGRLTGEKADQFKELLQTHLATKGLTPGWRAVKDVINLGTLTQLRTTLKHLTGVGLTAGKYGVKNTTEAAKLVLTKHDNAVVNRELGLDDQGHDFRDVGKLGAAVNKGLKATGMLKTLAFNNDVRATASHLRNQEWVKTDAGMEKFDAEYKDWLGGRYKETVSDLQAGKRTWNTDMLAAHELSKSQPIYRSNMTPAQAKSEGLGRLAYSLKPVMINLTDFMRREIGRKLTTPGQRAEGLKNLAGVVGLMTAANFGAHAITNLLDGNKDVELPEQAGDALLGIADLNTRMVKSGISKPSEFITRFLGMPTPIVDDVAHDLGGPFKTKTKRVFKNGKWQEESSSSFEGLATIRTLPLIGNLAYYWTPLGAGYYKEQAEAKKDFRDKLGELKNRAADAYAGGDSGAATVMMQMYNDYARKDPNGKVKPINVGALRKAQVASVSRQKKEGVVKP